MLTIQKRLKNLRVERGLTLEQLADQTGPSRSALGSYESDEFKDISHYALVRLVQTANAFVDAASANIVKQHDPGASDPYLRQLVAARLIVNQRSVYVNIFSFN